MVNFDLKNYLTEGRLIKEDIDREIVSYIADTYIQNAKKSKAKFYFLCGDDESEDMVSDMERMLNLIAENRCNCLHLTQSKVIKGGKHNEKLWANNFAKAMQWLY